MKKSIKKQIAISLAVLVSILIIGGVFMISVNSKMKITISKGLTPDSTKSCLGNIPTVSLVNDPVYEVMSNFTPNGIKGKYDGTDSFFAQGVTFTWKEKKTARNYVFYISTDKDFAGADQYVVNTNEVVVNDLFISKKYYCKVVANYGEKEKESSVLKFQTANVPRMIDVNGVSNARDIGGYFTTDGIYQVKQGMVYRGSEMDALSNKGKSDFLDKYKIKTDLDLRGQLTKSPLGDEVNFVNVSAPLYSIYKMTEDKRQALLTEIKTFTKVENYPIYMHCALGRDRTGTLAFLINALLGVSETDLLRDYEMSFFSEAGNRDGASFNDVIANFNFMLANMKKYSDGSIAQNTEKFMLDIGVTAEEISAIKNIMLERV